MEIKTDYSFGVIPYIYNEGKLEFFLINQHSSHLKNKYYWIFPKGHADEGETREQTATRELQEETQLILAALNSTVTFDIVYEFKDGDTLIKKTASFFLGQAASHAYTLDGEEVVEAGWFTYEAALERLTYQNAKDMLKSAHEYLLMTEG